MDPTKPGFKTSEFTLTMFVTVGGFAFAVLAMLSGALQDSGVELPGWVRAVGVAAGLGMVLFKALGYTNSRSALKLEGLRAPLTAMAPQLIAVVGQIADLVKDMKSGGLKAPATGGQTPVLVDSTAQRLAVAAQLVQSALPDHPIGGQLDQLALAAAGAVGDAKAGAVTTDAQAVSVLKGG